MKRTPKKRSTRALAATTTETTIHFYLPKHLAVFAWNQAAKEGLTFDDYCIKLLLEDADRLVHADRLQKERAGKIVKFPKRGHEI